MNIYDISKAAGVSIASVSRVINGADNVSEKTRKKVMDVIDEYGYTPNAYARGLGRGSMKTIGIMCSDSSDIYLANAIYYLETELRKNGYNSILCCTGYDLETKKQSFELLKSRQVDAFILAGSKYVEPNPADDQYIIDGAKEHPVMLVNGFIEGDNVYSIISDDKGGMKDAFIQLHESGAQKIIYVYSSDSFSGRQKIEGIRAGAKKCGIPEENLRIVKGKKDYSDIADLLQKEYEKEPFDSIIASSDTSGVGAVKFATRQGLNIPEDIQIVSYNNSKLAEASTPELTSVDAKLQELCSKTCKSLMKLLNPPMDENGEAVPVSLPGKTVVKTHLVKRQTTRF
ncbi:LacI family DNA-binding transcriptional regulator [Oribacterium sp. WCC10]|uniref:LacI family DNA-binding transcriptional regulator n=1 Tax=Oribacterium sp. WCC10 TaxID=1855343 RepID=UPI0008ECA587|nr:LacI family DNA-binding transcriptional regulator [Oribacterium sp. WCC10]SFG55886.1 transcriptional regulator, LacI family [Oribacterium sp. WCC10]